MTPGYAFFLVGPTATGKSAVAQALAERHHRAILSADSMAVYRGMDVGTAKPAAAERARVRYGGLDLVDPDADFSVWRYRQAALSFLRACWADRLDVIVVGGSGLYVKALTEGLDAPGETCRADRLRWEAMGREGGVEALQEELRRVAPARLAALADPWNPRRLIRALEMAAADGDAGQVAPADAAARRARARPALVGLTAPVARLTARIEERVSRLFAGGLIEEAGRLRERCPALSRTARQAIGYAEAFDLLEGRCTREEAEARCAVRTRRLAKRQRTWFRHQARVAWVELDDRAQIGDSADRVEGEWERYGPAAVATDE